MAKVIQNVGHPSLSGMNPDFGQTPRYQPISGAASFSTESNAKVTIRNANATWAELKAYVSANANGGTFTVVSRINGVTGNQALSIPTTTTGWFADTTHSDSITSGDAVNWMVDGASAGAVTFKAFTSSLSGSGSTFRRIIAADSSYVVRYAANSTANYFQIEGTGYYNITTEANTQFKFRIAGTLKSGLITTDNNGRTTNTTFSSRINGAAGNVSVVVTASTTGTFEDTSNSDTVAAGDLVNWKVLGGAEANTIFVNTASFEFVTTTGMFEMVSSNRDTIESVPAATTYYSPLSGRFDSTFATEANAQAKINDSYTIANLGVYVSANAGVTNGSVTLNKNGTGSALTVALTGLTTGWFEDTTHTVSVVANDLIGLVVVTGSVGATSITVIGVSATGPSTSGIKTFNGLAVSSVKTVNGREIASVKSRNGLA